MIVSLLDSIFQYWYIWTIAALLAAITVGFVVKFVFPTREIGSTLSASAGWTGEDQGAQSGPSWV